VVNGRTVDDWGSEPAALARRRRHRVAVGCVAVGLVAVAPSVWWLTGLPKQPDWPDPYFMVRPLDLPPGLVLSIGLVSITLVVVGAATMAREVTAGVWPFGWCGVAVSLGLLSAYVGWTYRIATMEVTGANIGGGMLVFGLAPVAIATLLSALRFAERASERRQSPTRVRGRSRPTA
jgi:hypothetical protein